MVLVKTARERRLAAGMLYEPVISAEPLLRGDSDTQRAPILLMLSARMARKRPSLRSASATLVTRSRPWVSVSMASERVAAYLIGRPSFRAAHRTRAYST